MEINQISSFEFQLKMDRKHEIFWNLEKFRIWNSAIAKFFRKLKLFFSFFFFFHQEKISTNFVTTTFVLVSFFRSRFKESKVNFRMKIFLIKLYNIKLKLIFTRRFIGRSYFYDSIRKYCFRSRSISFRTWPLNETRPVSPDFPSIRRINIFSKTFATSQRNIFQYLQTCDVRA